MLERPISPLVDALNSLGCDVAYVEKKHFPPLRINGKYIQGGNVDVEGTVSSQFISALMLIAPVLEKGLTINMLGKIVSESYIKLTAKVLYENGINTVFKSNHITISKQPFKSGVWSTQADWSSAVYWYQTVALSNKGELCLEGLHTNSGQGDEVVLDIFENFGVNSVVSKMGINISKIKKSLPSLLEFDCSSCPDLVPSIVVTAAALGVELKITGATHLKFKESDRITALSEELKKIDVNFTKKGPVLHLKGKVNLINSVNFMLNTHKDHRIAMSFAPLVISLGEMFIQNPNVVNKSYPNFWDDYKKFFQLIKN